MTGEPTAPPPAAALAAKPDATGERPPAPPPVPREAAEVAAAAAAAAEAAAAGGAAAGTEGGGSTSPSHLVVLSHGLAGTADDLSYLRRSLERAGGADVLVHSARCNQGKTKDGVVVGGTRLAKEILELIGSRPSLSRISLVGNSLGGLYVRYAAKLLYSDGGGTAGGPGGGATIAGLKPSVFMTIASPHLGVRRFTYVPLPSMVHPLARVLVGKTGADLFLFRNSGSGHTAAAGSEGGEEAREGAGTTPDPDGDGRESVLLYSMGTSEEFLRPLKAFRWRRAYANRRGDFMVPYGTAAFVEPNEGDGSEAPAAGVGGGGGGSSAGAPEKPQAPAAGSAGASDTGGAVAASSAGSAPAVGPKSFTVADRLLGAKNGAIVGFSRVGPAAASGPAAVASGKQGEPAQHGGGTGASSRIRGSAASRDGAAGTPKDKERRSMEQEMAAGLNSCGWEKVSVDFGSLAPFSHNKICALSRTRITTALYGSGRSVVDHAADFLVARDTRGVDGGADNGGSGGVP